MKLSDIVYTPDDIARDIVRHFQPSGRCLDPCKGNGAFLQFLPSDSEWCELNEGVDFFDYNKKVDWIISNPPFSILDKWLEHSYAIAANIVYLIPLPKLFNSARRMQMICDNGGIKEILFVTVGRRLGFTFGYACGAVHFQTGYDGLTKIIPMVNAPARNHSASPRRSGGVAHSAKTIHALRAK